MFEPFPIRSRADSSIVGIVLTDPSLHPKGYAIAWKLKASDEGYPGELVDCQFNYSSQCWKVAIDDEAVSLALKFIQETLDSFVSALHEALEIGSAVRESGSHTLQ